MRWSSFLVRYLRTSAAVAWLVPAYTAELRAEPGPKLDGWTYRIEALPLAEAYADPGNRLTDGKAGRDSGVAIWRAANVAVEIDLGGVCRRVAVRVHQHRHNLNYKLDYLAVSIRRGGAWEERARVPGFYGPTASMDFIHTLDVGGVDTQAMRLDFVGVGVLSLSEIELFGTRHGTSAAAAGPFADVPFVDAPGPTVSEADLDGDGQREVRLENAAVRLILTPAAGGVCRSLSLKPSGAELVCSREAGYGLFRDQLWKPDYSFAGRTYFHRPENGPEEAAVELWTTGVGGMMSFTEMRKRISLRGASPVIHVKYVLSNEPSSQTDYEYGMWFHNWLGEAGAANTYFFPTTDGVAAFTLDAAAGRNSDEAWYRNPARGWSAVLSDRGHGLAVTMPYRLLNLFYRWHGAGDSAATHEWRLNLLTLKAGEKIESDLALVPFTGLSAVDGVVGTVVGQLEPRADAQGVSVVARLWVPQDGAPGRARLALVPAGQPTGMELASAELRPGEVNLLSGRIVPLAPGAYVARVEISRDGDTVGSFERPVATGGAEFRYRLGVEGEQIGRREQSESGQAGHAISAAVVTPHLAWAKPLAGGKIRALMLLDDLNSREAVELAQRCDLDPDYTKFRTTFDKELLYQGDLSILTLDAARRALAERLRNRTYEVIIAAGFDWGFHFTPEIRAAILERVRSGTGLVLIQPDGFDQESAAELPCAGVARKGAAGRPMHLWHHWAPAGSHPLVTGLHWDRFPVTRRHEFDVPPQGEVVATIGADGAPLLVLGTVGRGRVVAATWDTLTHDLSYRGYSALTPILSYRGGWLRPEFAALPNGYHEWWYALLVRMTVWAAGRESGVTVVAAPPVAADLTTRQQVTVCLTVRSDRDRAGVTVQPEWFNAIGDLSAGQPVAADLQAGETQVRLPVPVPPQVTAGANTACFVIRGPAGESLAWGFTTLTLAPPAALADLQIVPAMLLPRGGVWQDDTPVETRAFEPDQPFRVMVRLKTPAEEPLCLDLRVADSRGRELVRLATATQPGSQTTDIEVPSFVLVDQGLEATVSLGSDDQRWDRRRARAVAYRPRVWDRFWYTSWDGQYLWRSEYLFDFNNRLVRDFGVDVSFWGDTELGTGKVRDNAFWGVNHSWLGLLSYLGPGVSGFMDEGLPEKAAQYSRDFDRTQLIRTPSLVDPAWREAVRKRLVEATQKVMPAGGAYDYCMGDEMSLTSYTRFHDFDWSEFSLGDFRHWLKTRYPSLSALNQAWGTDWRDWREVVPLTREEAVKAPNPAPWFEFRTYMNDQLADFFAFVQETIRGVDPQARCGLSGTQSPEAANGMDWWKLAQAFSYHHSYNTSWSNEMRRSYQRRGGAGQSPYFSGYSAVDPEAEYRMWWCLLHDTRGISAWKTGLFFYGDFTETQSGRDTRSHLQEFRRGVWRLLRGATRQHDGIAVCESMASTIAGALTGDDERINATRDAWVKLLEDSGLQYEFVAAPELALGRLKRGEFRVVILPSALALSQAEAEALREFARRGGTLIATRPIAGRDELGRAQPRGLLDDVFGVRLDGPTVAVVPVVRLVAAVGELGPGTELRLAPAATNLVLAGARCRAQAGPDGAIPVLTTSPDGRAHVLNLDLTQFEQERRFHSPTEKQLRAVLEELLSTAGVRPVYPITLANGRPAQIEVVRYHAPGIEYLGLLNAGNEAAVAMLPLGGTRQVYDLRPGVDRGTMQVLVVPVESQRCRVFGLTPSPLPGPTLTPAETVVSRRITTATGIECGGRMRLTVARGGAFEGRQLLRLDVRDSANREREELMQTIWVDGTPVPTVVPLALDDPLGAWSVTATDVVSGKAASATVTVR